VPAGVTQAAGNVAALYGIPAGLVVVVLRLVDVHRHVARREAVVSSSRAQQTRERAQKDRRQEGGAYSSEHGGIL
jgi:hypothetical protein